jgi:hypothetical protein
MVGDDMELPVSSEIINNINSCYSPSTPIANSMEYRFYCRYLYQKAISVFKWKIPEMWNKTMFLLTLYSYGYVGVFRTGEYGVIYNPCTVGGRNIFYEPAYVMLANPLLPELTGKQLEIGTKCALIRLTPDYIGILDLIGFYAEKMALASQGIDVNIINSKLAYVFSAKDATMAKSFKKMFDQITDGEPAVIVDKKLFNDDGSPNWQLFTQNLKQTYLADQLISDLRKIEDEFNTRIGIPNANTDKRERLITDEVNANNVETETLPELWLDNIKRGIDQAEKLFPEISGQINCDWRVKPNDGTAQQSDPVDSRSL